MRVRTIGLAVLAIAGVVLLIAFAACRDDDDGEATPEVTAAADEDVAALEEAANEVFVVFRGRRLGGLRALAATRLLERAGLDDFETLATCVPNDARVRLIGTEVAIDGDQGSVTVTSEVTQDGETTDVDRVWEFERQEDGEWALSDLPDCPFE